VPFVYIVECADGTLYTGWAVDADARVRSHNAGRGSVYCKHRRPVRLVYREKVPNRREAQQRESAIKRMPRRKKLELAEADATVQGLSSSPGEHQEANGRSV
jgi:putative endonuclease